MKKKYDNLFFLNGGGGGGSREEAYMNPQPYQVIEKRKKDCVPSGV